jgi:hypothetical protein
MPTEKQIMDAALTLETSGRVKIAGQSLTRAQARALLRATTQRGKWERNKPRGQVTRAQARMLEKKGLVEIMREGGSQYSRPTVRGMKAREILWPAQLAIMKRGGAQL